MNFTLPEKLAIVNAIDAVMYADGIIHNGEIDALGLLMKRIDFDSNFIVQARNVSAKQGLLLLDGMPEAKKQALAIILQDMAKADGFVHEKEIALIINIFASIGIGHEFKE
ncbi:MAG: TerB family tellurite resistance protein [Maribacter sp.]|nr:TerB family tellurite resistance protein [Maribacter sp.]